MKPTSYLVLHTLAAGKPKNWQAPITEPWNWPRLLRLSWCISTAPGEQKKINAILIRPQGFEIPAAVFAEHALSETLLLNEGISIANALQQLQAMLTGETILVAHNIGLHSKIIGAECARLGIPDILAGYTQVCTMISGTAFCKIPGTYGNKWPTLEELYQKLFSKPIPQGMAETEVVAACFWELKKLKQINIR
jgi:hypothetical protein